MRGVNPAADGTDSLSSASQVNETERSVNRLSVEIDVTLLNIDTQRIAKGWVKRPHYSLFSSRRVSMPVGIDA